MEVTLPRGALLCNRPALELFRHYFYDVRVRVKPVGEAISRLAIGEAGVELFPDFEREPRNFAVARFHMLFVVWIEFCVYERGPCRNGFGCKARNLKNIRASNHGPGRLASEPSF